MFRSIFNTFANCFKVPELKSRILFTLGMLAVCRLMALHHHSRFEQRGAGQILHAKFQGSGGLLGMYNTFAGGALKLRHRRAGHHALHQRDHHHPIAHGGLAEMSKLAREEGGRAKIIQYGRYLTLLLCIGQGWYFAAISWENPAKIFLEFSGPSGAHSKSIWWYRIQTVTDHDDGHDAADVAGRTDHRTRHRQRHFA
jgi:preprotein translocase subunit SecY